MQIKYWSIRTLTKTGRVWRYQHNTMAKRKRTKEQTTIYKTSHL